MVEIPLFKGTDRQKENPQNWLQRLEGSKFKYDTPDLQCIYTFSKHLEYGSKADIWFKALLPTEKDMWDHLEAAFHTKWPALARAVPPMEELQTEFFALTLTDEELGLKVGQVEGEEVYTHIDWALRVEALAGDIGDDKGLLIPSARLNLPVAVRTLLPNDIATWPKFTAAVCDVSLSRLTDESLRDRQLKAATYAIDNFSMASPHRFTSPASRIPTPRAPYQRLISTPAVEPSSPAQPTTPKQTPATAPATPMRSQLAPTSRALPPHMTRPLLPTPDSPLANAGGGWANLAQQAIAQNHPFPNTENGKHDYATAMVGWYAKYGENRADWSTGHVPLTPGSSPLGSNECFTCGIAGHMRPDCPTANNPIPTVEASWRARIMGIIRPKRNCFTESPGSLPVFKIDAEEVEVDPEVYDTSILEFRDSDSQGNRQGSR
jgi:hypothetical protein